MARALPIAHLALSAGQARTPTMSSSGITLVPCQYGGRITREVRRLLDRLAFSVAILAQAAAAGGLWLRAAPCCVSMFALLLLLQCICCAEFLLCCYFLALVFIAKLIFLVHFVPLVFNVFSSVQLADCSEQQSCLIHTLQMQECEGVEEPSGGVISQPPQVVAVTLL